MNITSIRYINMDKNWHRKLFMQSLLRSVPYPVQRCAGVHYDNKNSAYNKYLSGGISPRLKSSRIVGVIGCWIAHSRALEDITVSEGITVILEDDIICTPSFFGHALQMVNGFDRNFDIILFDPWGIGPLDIHKLGENIYKPINCSYPYYGGTHCLFVNNASIKKILEIKLNSQIVDYDGFLFLNEKIETYIFYSGECAIRDIGSDIAGKKLKYDISSILLSLLPYKWSWRIRNYRKYFNLPVPRKLVRFTTEDLKLYEGFYKLQGHDNLYIKFLAKANRLIYIQIWDSWEMQLLQLSDVEFFSTEFPIAIKFMKGKEGNITQVVIQDREVGVKDNSYLPAERKAISLSPLQLKIFEGKYRQVEQFTIQIAAAENSLLIKQLWDGKELTFVPEAELQFFYINNHSFPIRFVKNENGTVVEVIAFERDVLTKVE